MYLCAVHGEVVCYGGERAWELAELVHGTCVLVRDRTVRERKEAARRLRRNRRREEMGR